MLERIPTKHIGRWVLGICVVLQLGSLTTLALLNYSDDRLELVSLQSMLLGQVSSGPFIYHWLLPALAYLLMVTLGVFAVGIFFAHQAQRSLKNLFVLTTIIALTLALFSNWQRVSWEGRRYRMSKRIAALQPICDSLLKDWPTIDTNHALLGPIMAYPNWKPTTLILLEPLRIDDRFHIAAVDRSEKQVLRFELSSGYENIWLEYRSNSKLDTDFTNGIAQHYTLQKFVSLSPHWYLVRYQ